jgi:chromosome segregation ATPase
MKNRLFLFIGVAGLVSLFLCGDLSAGEQDLTGIDYEAAVEMDGAEDGIPRWSSSLDGIQSSAAALLEANRKLGAEARELSSEVDVLTAELLRQQQKIKEKEESLRQKGAVRDLPEQTEEVKAELIKKEREIAQAKSSLAELKARQQVADRRITLLRLKYRELELEKKAALLDQKDAGNSDLNALGTDVQSLKGRLERQKERELDLQKRIAALGKTDDPKTAQQRQLFEENRSRKADLERLAKEERELEALIRGEIPSGMDPDARARFQRYQQEEVRQRSLKEAVARMQARKEELSTQLLTAGDTDRELKERIKALQDQNRFLEVQLENLRENLAILDYKLNTLERYRDRNKAN